MRTPVRTIPFGVLSDGSEARLFVLDNGSMRVALTDYGATLASVLVPAGGGLELDMLLGPSTLAGFASNRQYFGATVGRFANRIGGARFRLGGAEYALAANNGANHLHGGLKGFDKRLWKAEAGADRGDPAVVMSLSSPDGEEGYPGALSARATFVLRADCALSIRYEAEAGAPTPVSMTNHAYWNLRGEGDGDVLGHELELRSSRYVKVDEGLIPVGAPEPVDGTPFDFRDMKPMGRDILAAGGYDHCFALDDYDGKGLVSAARVVEPVSGRSLGMATTMPGVQLYTGNFLAGIAGKRGSVYDRHSGFCLEAEYYPDSPNRPDFPSCVLGPGERYDHRIEYRLGF